MPGALIQRAALLAGAMLAIGAVLQAGIAQTVSRLDPALATRIAPGNARIALAAARAAVDKGADISGPDVRMLVQTALARDATLPGAIELRAVDLGAAGDARRQARLFDLSNAISRRSLPTRLWLIQRSVDRGDVGGALRDFDVALRTSAAAPSVLFPVLADATSDPGLVGPIARMLDQPSDWRLMFLNYATARGDAPGIAAVVVKMRDRTFVRANGIDRAIVMRFVALRSFAWAGRVHGVFSDAKLHPLVADGDFTEASAIYPFGWSLTNRGESGAEGARAGDRSVLSYRAEPGRGGQVAAQLLLLAPGNYRLTTVAASNAVDGPPYWSLVCGEENGATLAKLDVSAQDRAVSITDFRVSAGCSGQWLTLTVRPDGTTGGQAGAVASVSVTRR